jgi:HAD superfamily hydrolase (TIGR01509 family)
MNKNPKNEYAILWDLDGVLIDTGQTHFLAWNRILAQVGKNLTEDGFAKTYGMNNQRTLDTLFDSSLSQNEKGELSEQKEIMFRQMIDNCKVFPGVIEWLAYFRDHKYKQAVASSGPLVNIKLMMERFSIIQYFDLLQSGENMKGKPDPLIFITTAQRLGITIRNCLVIEDSIAGVQAAKAANMHCLAVATSYTMDELSKADLVRPDLQVFTEADLNFLLNP